jgi:hypothetical protein
MAENLSMNRRKVAEMIPWVTKIEVWKPCRAITVKGKPCKSQGKYWFRSLKKSKMETGHYCLWHLAAGIHKDKYEAPRFDKWYMKQFGHDWYYGPGSHNVQNETLQEGLRARATT